MARTVGCGCAVLLLQPRERGTMTDTIETTTGANTPRKLREIAADIFADWKTMRNKGVIHPAWPYADAMRSLDTIDDMYYADRADDIVQRFLGNAAGWRGEKAKAIKAELKAIVGK